MTRRPKIHLVSYATPRFRHRQIILGISARWNRVVDTVTAWTPQKLKKAGFEKSVPGIGLYERGSGYWSWKPFIIRKRLMEVPEGDFVLYCDVGRIYPFKLLDQSISPYLRWMEEQGQEIMPGIEIPWDGPVVRWTKRDALVALNMDREEILRTTPIQASFSIWRSGKAGRDFVSMWRDLCSRRRLISDDPSACVLGEHPGFCENRHDQALLTLLCIKEGVSGLFMGNQRPCIDTRNPAEVSRMVFGEDRIRGAGRILRSIIWPLEVLERHFRPPVAKRPMSDIHQTS